MSPTDRTESPDNYIEARRQLTEKVKACLIEGLTLDLKPEEIGLDSPFFGSGLGLDSVDALGIAASIEQTFGIEVLDSDINLFRSVNATVDFILERQGALPPGLSSPLPGALVLTSSDDLPPAEHDYTAARTEALLLDLSPTEKVRVTGPGCEALLVHRVAGNISDLAVGDILHSVLLDDEGALQRLVWVLREESGYLVLGGEESAGGVVPLLAPGGDEGEVQVEDVTEELGLLSIVGPRAQERVIDFFDPDLLRLSYCQFAYRSHGETPVRVCRYGDSGEFDYRLLLPRPRTAAVAAELEERTGTMRPRGSASALGLVLAMEMKSVRQAFVAAGTWPTQLDLHWMVQFSREDFRGAKALREHMKAAGRRAMLLVGPDGRLDLPLGDVRLSGTVAGRLQWGAYSCTLDRSVYLAYIDPSWAWPGVEFTANDRQGAQHVLQGRSAPLFVTRTVTESLNI